VTALFTRQAEQAAGGPLTTRIDARTVADPADYPELAADGATALRRDGHLVTASGRPVAAVTSVFLPGRLPSTAVRLLARTATPLGAALEPYGVRREELSPEGPRTRGLLWLAGQPVALAWELAL
jgi:chorismate-pyruvate lyase